MSTDSTWEGPDTQLDLNRLTPLERVARVERLVQGYHEVVAEGGTLASRVQALDNRGGELVTSLDRINKTTEDLIALRAQVDDMEELRRQERAQAKSRAFTAIVLAIMIIGGIVFGFWLYAKSRDETTAQFKTLSAKVCADQSQQAQILNQYLTNQQTIILNSTLLSEADKSARVAQIEELKKAFPQVDCDALQR
jgi:hypothetical protein